MLREIFRAFRQRDVVQDLSGHVGQMLDAARWMFEQASSVLMRKADWQEVCDLLYTKDREINTIEQQIRERIVTHLSVGNQADLPVCLVLMNVVKDAERIGDYGKNIFEVAKSYAGTFEHAAFREPLEEIRQSISDLFEPTHECFLNSDSDIAQEVLAKAGQLNARCDQIVQQLLSAGEGFPAREAVAYALLARHYKRVEAHLSNIATAVVSPIPMLDFRERT